MRSSPPQFQNAFRGRHSQLSGDFSYSVLTRGVQLYKFECTLNTDTSVDLFLLIRHEQTWQGQGAMPEVIFRRFQLENA